MHEDVVAMVRFYVSVVYGRFAIGGDEAALRMMLKLSNSEAQIFQAYHSCKHWD